MTTPTPTTENIARVQSNLQNMQDFNDYTYNNGGAYIGNCYLRMSSTDSSDPGFTVGVCLLEGALGAIGAGFGVVGGFASVFLCGEISSWSAGSEPDLNADFGTMLIRYQQSSAKLDERLADYIVDPVSNWNKQFTWQGQSCVLGDLATFDFPTESEPSFYPMAQAALKGLDQEVWKQVLLASCYITWWAYQDGPKMIASNTDMNTWDQHFIANNPAWYCTWQWHSDTGAFDKNWWYVYEYNVGFGASNWHDGSIPLAACQYLFQDSEDGVVINPAGLYPRKTVFEGLGLRKALHNDN